MTEYINIYVGLVCICMYLVYIRVCPFPFLQEACVNLWRATENEIVDQFEVTCNEFQPCGSYDVIKLDIANCTSVSKTVIVQAMRSHNCTIMML